MAEDGKKTTGKLLDWLPGGKDIEALEGIERELRTRKRSGDRWSFVLAALGVAYQVLLQFQGKELQGLGQQVIGLLSGLLPQAWRSGLAQYPGAIGLVLLVAAALVFIGVRFTSLLLTLSREPFRYSFSVSAFNSLSSGRATLQAQDRLALLPLDLTERIDTRIDRLSLLRATPAAGAAAAEGTSHIAISGDVALREDGNGAWELFAMPRVRIGDAAAPETLSFPVRFPLSGARTATGEVAFSAEQYHQFCERVYASVALAIYRRIDADLEDKVAQFPTTFRRAVARLNEADDFAQSNTIDANERAEAQYLKALQDLNRTWSLALARWACAWQMPLAWYLRVFELHAAILAGMARCAVTRSITANLAGRPARPSYAVRAPLLRLVQTLRPIQRRAAHRNQASLAQRLVAARLPRLEVWRQARQQRQQRLTRALFDSLVAMALAHAHADEPARARIQLDEALAVGPDIALRNREYLWVDADLRPDIEGRIDRLRRLMDIAPDFQIGQFQLAVWLEMRMRALDQITPEGARAAITEYERVLAINPGNVAALASLGYLHWLLEDLEPAQRRFEEGLALRDVVRETFVGELKYGLARVWADKPPAADLVDDARQLHHALACFEIAVETAPDLATADVRSERGAAAGELEFIGPALLQRFGRYRGGVVRRLRALRRGHQARVVAMQPALARLYAFVCNDAGNAALQFHVRLKDPSTLHRAGRLFALAVRAWPHGAAAHVNRVRHAEWAGLTRPLDALDAALRLAPDWQRPRIDRLAVRHGEFRAAREALDRRIHRLQRDLGRARSERPGRAEPSGGTQPALRALQPGDTRLGDLTEHDSRHEAAQSRIERVERELQQAEAERQVLDANWRREVGVNLSSLLRRFPLGRLIDAGGALPTDRDPFPVSSRLADPTIDVERLAPAEQELLLSALRALEYLPQADTRVGDEILRCCAALRRRLSAESWSWANLQCDLLERIGEKDLHETDRRVLRLARQQRLAIVWRWVEGDPVHSNALGWLLRLHATSVAAGELDAGEFDAGLQAMVRAAAGPMATPAARRALVRLLLELSAERLGNDPRPASGTGSAPPAREYGRVLALAARQLAHPRGSAMRADWAEWYGALTRHLDAQPQTPPLRRLRLTAVAAGRTVQPAPRARWWSRCAEIASEALIDEPDRFATARVDFAGWYARALRESVACGGAAEAAAGSQADLGAHRVADGLRRRFFDSDPPREVGVAAVTVLLDARLVALVATADAQLTPQIEAAIGDQRDGFQQRYGIQTPPLRFRSAGPGATPGGWGLLLREVPVAQGQVDFDAEAPPLAQLMARVQTELEARLPTLVGLQEIDGLLDAVDGSLADAVRAHPRGLPRLLALSQALLAQRLALDMPVLARLVLEEPSPDLDLLVMRARASGRVRQQLIARAAGADLWALAQPLQRRLLDFIDGDGDSRCLALWPDDASSWLAAMRAKAPADGMLGIVIDEPLLLTGVSGALHLSGQPGLVLLRRELALHQQFALKGEVDDITLAGAR